MTRVMVIGSGGFVGRNVVEALAPDHKLIRTTSKPSPEGAEEYLDLSKPDTIRSALKSSSPEIIVNCAGIVENTEAAAENLLFTRNLLEAVTRSGIAVGRIIISGSAAEYGIISEEDLPVKESTPLRADAGYGLYKAQETTFALEYGRTHNLNILIARIFNPIGIGMNRKFLIPKILEQVNEIITGDRETMEISRRDSMRDYVDARDLAIAFKELVENDPKEYVYNIGSGVPTTNARLVELVAKFCGLEKPKIEETAAQPEKLVAIQADISRIQSEFGWAPQFTIEQTVKEIVNASTS